MRPPVSENNALGMTASKREGSTILGFGLKMLPLRKEPESQYF
jgi:hypothetical protein